ncbi:hypothetical protein [Rubritalea marina]|uniref:hypothetical protein n=1 Tax=Rubritalea marina TaxID=361055 RepID=UPI0012EAA1CB|nr:hypothetical protein [Rubritalea marina]
MDSDRSKVGYDSADLTVFDHWLTRDEFASIFPLDELKSIEYSSMMYDFYKSLRGEKYEHVEDYVLLSHEDYLAKIKRNSPEERIMDFYLEDYGILVSGGFEYSDSLVFPVGHDLNEFNERALSFGLHILC